MNTVTYPLPTPTKLQNPVVLLHLTTPYNSRTYPNLPQPQHFQIALNPKQKLQIFEKFRNLPTRKNDFRNRLKKW